MRTALITAITVITLAATGFVGTAETHYVMDGVVVETYDNTIILEDVRGHEWICNGTTDKTNVRIIFDNNGTDNKITDDFVVGLK